MFNAIAGGEGPRLTSRVASVTVALKPGFDRR